MAFSVDGFVNLVASAENAASAAMNGINSTSSVAAITKAGYASSVFSMVVTAVSQALKTDAEAKSAAARTLGR